MHESQFDMIYDLIFDMLDSQGIGKLVTGTGELPL